MRYRSPILNDSDDDIYLVFHVVLLGSVCHIRAGTDPVCVFCLKSEILCKVFIIPLNYKVHNTQLLTVIQIINITAQSQMK
jgi:hypothetical protein